MIPKPRLLTDLIIENGNAVFDAGSKSGYVSVAPSMATFVGTPPEPLDALDASVNLNIDGASSSASIRLPKGMNIDGRAYVEMFTVNGSAGVFRTRSPQIGYGGNSTTLQLEHSINQLGDFIITDKLQEQLTVRKAFEKIFQYYASKDVQQLWMLGEVDDPKDNDVEDWEVKCVLDVDYDNCLDAVLGVMEQYPLMMLEFDFSTRPWKLNVRNRPQVVMAEARLSRNVKSAMVTRDDSELFTRVYMDGYKNKNGKYGHYDSTSGKKKYGLIETVISGANDTAAIAQRTVKSYMRNHKTPRISVTIDGIELSQLTGEPLDRFAIGKMMRLALPDYGETVTETLTSLAFPSIYKQPNSCTVTMNSEEDRVIRYIKKAQKSAAKAGKAAASVGKAALTKAEVINANTLRLTHGDGTYVDFSKAVTLKKYPEDNNGWSNGTFTVRAYQSNTVNGKKVETQVKSAETKISSIDLQANKVPTIDGMNIKIPLKVMYNNNGYKGNTQYTQTFTVDGTPLYTSGFNAGWRDAAGKVTIPPNIESSTIKAAVAVSYPFSVGSGSTQVNQKVTETYTMMTDPLPIQTPTRYTKVNLWRANSKGTAIGVVARINVGNVWEAGWRSAYDKVQLPKVTKTNSNTIVIETPSYNFGTDTTSYYLWNTEGNNNAVDLLTNVNGEEITVARWAHNKYNAGKSDALVAGAWENGTYKAYNTSNPQNHYVTTSIRKNVPDAKRTISGDTVTATIQVYNGTSETPEDVVDVKINVPQTSYTSKTLRCTEISPTYPGSSSNYYYFRLEGRYSFSTNTNYTMYRTSW